MSPLIANELCYRAGLDGNASTDSLTDDSAAGLYGAVWEKSLIKAYFCAYASNNHMPEPV